MPAHASRRAPGAPSVRPRRRRRSTAGRAGRSSASSSARSRRPRGRHPEHLVERRPLAQRYIADGEPGRQRLAAGQLVLALEVVEFAHRSASSRMPHGTAARQVALVDDALVAARLVDERRGHGGERRGVQVVPEASAQRLGHEQVSLAVDAPQHPPGAGSSLSSPSCRRPARGSRAPRAPRSPGRRSSRRRPCGCGSGR